MLLQKLPTSGLDDPNLRRRARETLNNIVDLLDSGTYTPTLAIVANLTAVTAFKCQWLRVGNVVTVGGRFDADPTTTALFTSLTISLPVATTTTAASDIAGTAAAPSVAGQCAAIFASSSLATVGWVAGDVTNQDWYFTFSYEVR